MSKKNELVVRLKKEGLSPNPKEPGEFVKNGNGKDGLGFLSPNNWVFHDQVVEKVLDGDYTGIMPYSGEFVTTLNCSNRCGIPCSYQVPKELEGVWEKNDFKNSRLHMESTEFAIEMLDKLIDGGIKGVTFTGGGEPFLFKGLDELVQHANNRGVDSVVYSNGNAAQREKVEKVIAGKPKLVRVSLNAGTDEVYNKFHNPLKNTNALQRCIDTIKTFAKGSMENPDMTFGVAVVINEINRYDLGETAKRIREIVDETGGGIKFVTYRPAYDYYCSQQLNAELLDETHEIVETDVRKILEGSEVKVSNLTFRYDALKEDMRDYDRCLASGLYFELAPPARLHICCDRNCHRDYEIGDLTENTLEEVWRGEKREAMIEYINNSKCSICPPSCKPDLTNKQFNRIEELRKQGDMYKVELWINEQRKMQKPKMVNF